MSDLSDVLNAIYSEPEHEKVAGLPRYIDKIAIMATPYLPGSPASGASSGAAGAFAGTPAIKRLKAQTPRGVEWGGMTTVDGSAPAQIPTQPLGATAGGGSMTSMMKTPPLVPKAPSNAGAGTGASRMFR